MVYIISNRITQWLCREDSLSEHYALILYGIQSLLNDCLKISLLFFLFAGFGKQKEFCVTLLGIGAMRRLVGGQHCKSFWRCFLCTLGILTVTVFLGDMVSGTLFWFMLPSFLTAGICIYFVGVVDTNGILTAGKKDESCSGDSANDSCLDVTSLWIDLSFKMGCNHTKYGLYMCSNKKRRAYL